MKTVLERIRRSGKVVALALACALASLLASAWDPPKKAPPKKSSVPQSVQIGAPTDTQRRPVASENRTREMLLGSPRPGWSAQTSN